MSEPSQALILEALKAVKDPDRGVARVGQLAGGIKMALITTM